MYCVLIQYRKTRTMPPISSRFPPSFKLQFVSGMTTCIDKAYYYRYRYCDFFAVTLSFLHSLTISILNVWTWRNCFGQTINGMRLKAFLPVFSPLHRITPFFPHTVFWSSNIIFSYLLVSSFFWKFLKLSIRLLHSSLLWIISTEETFCVPPINSWFPLILHLFKDFFGQPLFVHSY